MRGCIIRYFPTVSQLDFAEFCAAMDGNTLGSKCGACMRSAGVECEGVAQHIV
jgi:hypothetical protein